MNCFSYDAAAFNRVARTNIARFDYAHLT